MNRRGVVGVDVGTTTVKVVVADLDSVVLGEATSSALVMESDDSGRSEESPTQLLHCVTDAISDACQDADRDVDLVGLAVASQSGSIAAIDDSGTPVGPLVTWMDERSRPIVDQWIASTIGDRIRSISGWNAGTGLGLSTLAWIGASHPDLHPGARTFVGADTLVTHFLTGRATTNHSNAAAMQFMDVSQGEWSQELCDLAAVSPAQLPELGKSGDPIGEVSAEAAAACGLPPGLSVIAGGHDQTCAAFALDVVEPGHVLLGTGTAWVVTAVADASAYRSIPSQFNVSSHVVAGRITASEYLGGLGAEFESWVMRTYGSVAGGQSERPSMFAAAEADITEGLGGDAIEIMEHAADRVRISLDQLTASDSHPTRITIVGGATASSVWPAIIADATGLPVAVRGDSSWPAIGAARLASLNPDIHPSPHHNQGPDAQETNP